MSSVETPARVLRTRPSTGNTKPEYSSSDDESEHSALSPAPRAVESPEAFEQVKSTPGYIFFEELVNTLFARPEGEGFRKPVLDLWTDDAVPGYLDVVKEPMDLGTIKDKLKQGEYSRTISDKPCIDEKAIKRDICLVFKNCMEYNEPQGDYYRFAETLLNAANEAFVTRDAALKKEKEEAKKERKREKDRLRHAARYAAKKPERDAAKRKKDEERAKQKAEARKRAEEEAAERAELKAIQKVVDRKRSGKYRDRKEASLRELNQAKEMGLLPNVVTLERKRLRDENPNNVGGLYKKARKDPDERSTSSISSGEADEIHEEMELVNGETVRDLMITFVSTEGLEKKRGRKSVTVQALEEQHAELMKQRRIIQQANNKLNKLRHKEMTNEEKKALCEKVQVCDYLIMKKVVEILANRLGQPSLLQENEIDVDLTRIENPVLREIEIFLENPVVATLQGELPDIEKKLTDIEAHYISIRYQTGAPLVRRSM